MLSSIKIFKNKKLLYSSLLLALSVFFVLFCLFNFLYRHDNKYTAPPPHGKNGVFSFAERDLSKPLPLIDGWELYPDRLYAPSDFKENEIPPERFTFIGQYSNFSFFEKGHSPFGDATYRLTLNYSGKPKSIGLEIPEIFTEYTLWADGEEIASTGKSGMATFVVHSSTELLLHVRNHTHYYSGLTYPPLLGTGEVISRVLLTKNMFYGVLCIFSLSLCLFAVVSLMTKGYNRRFAHFGLLCFFFALQTSYHFIHGMGVSGVFWYALEDTARMAVLYETIALCTVECDLHIKAWYRKIVKPISVGFCLLTAVTVLFIIPFQGEIINLYGAVIDSYRFLCFFYLCGCAGYGILHEHKGSGLVLAACAATGVSLYLNMVQNSRFEPIYTGWQTEYTTLALVIIFWCLILQHVRELVKTNRQLTGDLSRMVYQRTDELHAVLEERKAFFSNLAHDMKAPIASIHGFVNLILRGNLYVDQDLKEYLSLIGSETDELGRRVQALSDLHDFDKIAAPAERIHLNELLAQIYHDNEPETCAAGILLKVTETDSQAYLFGVRKKLLTLFENLIYNAMSFTPEDGSIVISATIENDFAVITLSDTGCGILPEHLPHIFERFYSARKNKGEGSGLGLYIAKITVEEMGGSICAESTLGEGARFFIRLPVSVSAE